MFVVRNFRLFFNVSQNYSDVFARFVCCTSIRNDFKFHSLLCQNSLVLPRIQVNININHDFSTQGVLFKKKQDQTNFESKHVEGFIPNFR